MSSMLQWLRNLLLKLWNWGMHDRPKLARGVSGDEAPVKVSGRVVAEWPEESIPKLDDGSNAQRLEKEEGDQGSGTSKLSKQSGGVLSTSEGSGNLDYSMKEHFFSPHNPTNK